MATAAHPLLPPRVSKCDYAQSASRHSLPRRLAAPGPATLPSFLKDSSPERFEEHVRYAARTHARCAARRGVNRADDAFDVGPS